MHSQALALCFTQSSRPGLNRVWRLLLLSLLPRFSQALERSSRFRRRSRLCWAVASWPSRPATALHTSAPRTEATRSERPGERGPESHTHTGRAPGDRTLCEGSGREEVRGLCDEGGSFTHRRGLRSIGRTEPGSQIGIVALRGETGAARGSERSTTTTLECARSFSALAGPLRGPRWQRPLACDPCNFLQVVVCVSASEQHQKHGN